MTLSVHTREVVFFKRREHTAAKVHDCRGCAEKIKPGDAYIAYATMTKSNGAEMYKYHQACDPDFVPTHN